MHRRCADDHARKLGSASPHQPRDANHLAFMDGETDLMHHIAHGAMLRIPIHAQQFDALRLCVAARKLNITAYHCAHHFTLGQRIPAIGAHHLPVAQHRHTVANFEDLVKMMRDVDNGDSLRLQPPDHAEEILDFGARERGSRLIQDDDLAVERKRLGHCDQLLLGHLELAYRHRRVNLCTDLLEVARGVAAHGRPIDRARSCERLTAEGDVFSSVERGDQVNFLVNGIDTMQAHPGGRRVVQWFALVENRA